MEYCMTCGGKLILKDLKNEGKIPFCPVCNKYHFEPFSCAVSMVVLDKETKKTLFIQQYGKKRNILVAGYINKGESAEEAVGRELLEETGLIVERYLFNQSEYFSKTNTLMLNFMVWVKNKEVHPNEEVDAYHWYDIEEGLKEIAPNSLAEKFYQLFYKRMIKNEI